MLDLFRIKIASITLDEAAGNVLEMVSGGEFALVVTPNVDHIVTLHKDKEFRRIYEQAKLIVADGMPLVWLSKILPGPSLPERVTGADMLERVCALAGEMGMSVGFIGGNPGVAGQAAVSLSRRYHGLQIAGVYSPPFGFEKSEFECQKIVTIVRTWRADILLVGLGAPKQEKFAWRYLRGVHDGPVLCVGAAFDFSAGIKKRAPRWIQKFGVEWLWRMAQEPRRLVRRYLIRDLQFLYYAVQEVFAHWKRYVLEHRK